MNTRIDSREPLRIPRRQINQHFRIRIYPSLTGKGNNSLVGVSGLVEITGPELAERLLEKAYEKGADKTRHRLRRGIMIEFANR